jgi:hypothetical protein
MSQQEQQALLSLFGLLKQQNDLIAESRRRAYRKSLYPDFFQETDHTRNLKHELQGQLHAIARADYLNQVATDYLKGEIRLEDLQEIINEARIQALILN